MSATLAAFAALEAASHEYRQALGNHLDAQTEVRWATDRAALAENDLDEATRKLNAAALTYAGADQ